MKRMLAALVICAAVIGTAFGSDVDGEALALAFEVGRYQDIESIIQAALPGKTKELLKDRYHQEGTGCLMVYGLSKSKGEKTAFLDMLKAAGYNITYDEKNAVYRVRVVGSGDTIVTIEVDVSAFKGKEQRIVDIQNILNKFGNGKDVFGGEHNQLKIANGSLPLVNVMLQSANFSCNDCQRDGVRTWIITEKQVPITIFITNVLQFNMILPFLNENKMAFAERNGKLILSISHDQFDMLKNGLRDIFGNQIAESSANFQWEIIPPQPRRYGVTVFLYRNGSFNARKDAVMKALVSDEAKWYFELEANEPGDAAGPVQPCHFFVKSYMSRDDLHNTVCKLLNPCGIIRKRIATEEVK